MPPRGKTDSRHQALDLRIPLGQALRQCNRLAAALARERARSAELERLVLEGLQHFYREWVGNHARKASARRKRLEDLVRRFELVERRALREKKAPVVREELGISLPTYRSLVAEARRRGMLPRKE